MNRETPHEKSADENFILSPSSRFGEKGAGGDGFERPYASRSHQGSALPDWSLGTRWSESRGRAFFFAMILCLILGQTLRAEPPEVVCSVSENEVFMGESITYQVDVRYAENPSAPNINALNEQFAVELIGDQSRNQSSTMIINGRVSQSNSFSHVYQYRLTAKLAGNLKIPPVTASIDGKILTSNSLSIRIELQI